MTSILQSSFETSRPQTHQGIHSSPAGSPRPQRPASQASLHIAPTYSPDVVHEQSPHPMTAFPSQNYRHYTPASMAMPGPPNLMSTAYPSTAPPVPFYPGTTPIYDSRGSQPMIRTISHAHPMSSATETVPSRYSSSPHSAGGPLMDSSVTASGQQPNLYPGLGLHSHTFNFQSANGHESKSINPSLFNPSGSYSMSRSTSGASDFGPETTRLLTPAYEYRQDRLTPTDNELRKVSDSLGDFNRRPYASFTPNSDFQPHTLNFGPPPQPESVFFGGRGYGNDHFTVSAERGDAKPDIAFVDTEYERERQAQIMSNRKVFEEIGLADPSAGFRSARSSSGAGRSRARRQNTSNKQRLRLDVPVRASPRLRDMSRTVSYADLDGGPPVSGSDEEYGSDLNQDEEDDFRPSKRSKGTQQAYRTKSASYSAPKMIPKPQLSLWGLLNVYPEIPHLFPLFYYTLNNDLTINSDSVPLIGSIPSTCTPQQKADMLQAYFHRGRRVLAQLDAFNARCDRKYEGPEQRWPELDYHTRIAIRDVRRKVVERCENYKYTRRDILDKVVGKNKWQPIDHGLIEWRVGMAQNDPAGDLENVTFTLPTPPPEAYNQQMRYQRLYSSRSIKPFPRSRMPSSAAPRTVSIAMGEPEDYVHPHTAMGYPPNSGIPLYTGTSGYSAQGPPPPQYGEDQVPMTVQLPDSSAGAVPSTANLGSSGGGLESAAGSAWGEATRGIKRARSQEEEGESPESEENGQYNDSYALA